MSGDATEGAPAPLAGQLALIPGVDEPEPEPAPAAEVAFYRASERPWGVFSNLYRRPVEFEGRTYPTAEHAYQAGKPRKPEVREWLLAAPSPALLAVTAHALLPWDIAPGWSRGRRDRMRTVVRAKFGQHPDLAETLLSTGDARIVETPSTDSDVNRRWGEVNGSGSNWLGLILMEVRGEIRAAAERAGDDATDGGPAEAEHGGDA